MVDHLLPLHLVVAVESRLANPDSCCLAVAPSAPSEELGLGDLTTKAPASVGELPWFRSP